jgi:thioredoxin reductase (NADPH)
VASAARGQIDLDPGDLRVVRDLDRLAGDRSRLERVKWKDKQTGEISTHQIRHVFIMAGASPKTEWLRRYVAMDDNGFILTGRDLDDAGPPDGTPRWPLSCPAQMLETSLPGVFAVGDVHAGNVKRVASAVGEGAISIHLVHRALAELYCARSSGAKETRRL